MDSELGKALLPFKDTSGFFLSSDQLAVGLLSLFPQADRKLKVKSEAPLQLFDCSIWTLGPDSAV